MERLARCALLFRSAECRVPSAECRVPSAQLSFDSLFHLGGVCWLGAYGRRHWKASATLDSASAQLPLLSRTFSTLFKEATRPHRRPPARCAA
jgi:hypothetical protein